MKKLKNMNHDKSRKVEIINKNKFPLNKRQT